MIGARASLGAVALAAGPTAAASQREDPSAFLLGVTLSPWGTVLDSVPSSLPPDRGPMWSGTVRVGVSRLGEAPGPMWGVLDFGVELIGWATDSTSGAASHGNVQAFATVAIVADTGAFIRSERLHAYVAVGMGYATAASDRFVEGQPPREDRWSGAGSSLGLGVDIRLNRHWFLAFRHDIVAQWLVDSRDAWFMVPSLGFVIR